jgi:FlaA1/EpsC-like NDP-sugar epimerase
MIHGFDVLFGRLRNRHLLAVDLVSFLLTPLGAVMLRTEGLQSFETHLASLAIFTFVFLISKLVVFVPLGLYNRYWRYASVDELSTLSVATISSLLVNLVLFLGVMRPLGILDAAFPRSIVILDSLLTTLAVGAARFSVRLGHAMRIKHGSPSLKRRRVLVVGAGVAGSMVVKELRANQNVGLDPVGFIDDDPEKLGTLIHGVAVLGTRADFAQTVKEYDVSEVIIAMPTAPGNVIREVVQSCNAARIMSTTIPGYFELLSGEARVSQIRNIRIEDLLRRGTVQTETANVGKLIHESRILVTGAGGSIGSELVRQIAGFGPKELVLVGHGEDSIYTINEELKDLMRTGAINSSMKVRPVIADIRDRARLEEVFATHRPHVVFHAAAHKHVPLMEWNVTDAVTNNVLGTRNIAELSEQFRVKRFVMISTDKAVNPTSIMGATKRVAELVVLDIAERSKNCFVIVRFGNVLGSRGSVVPLFERQIQHGGPITITDPRIERFFMTIPESVQLVLQAATMGEGGEVFVLDMGKPIKIADLAKDIIRLKGLEEGRDINIVYTGLRPGEKLSEQLFFPHERVERTAHEKVLVARNGKNHTFAANWTGDVRYANAEKPTGHETADAIRTEINNLILAAQRGTVWHVKHFLKTIVPHYQSNGSGHGREELEFEGRPGKAARATKPAAPRFAPPLKRAKVIDLPRQHV